MAGAQGAKGHHFFVSGVARVHVDLPDPPVPPKLPIQSRGTPLPTPPPAKNTLFCPLPARIRAELENLAGKKGWVYLSSPGGFLTAGTVRAVGRTVGKTIGFPSPVPCVPAVATHNYFEI